MFRILKAQRCAQDILQPHVSPLKAGLPIAIFQHDNARPHIARVTKDSLRNVATLLWPTRSPYLSLIEHVWDHLKRQLRQLREFQDFETQLQQLWSDMLQDIIRNL